MCSVRSIVKWPIIKWFEHFVLDSIVRMAIHRFVDHRLVDAILKCTNRHSINRAERREKKNRIQFFYHTWICGFRKIFSKTKEMRTINSNPWMCSRLFCFYFSLNDIYFSVVVLQCPCTYSSRLAFPQMIRWLWLLIKFWSIASEWKSAIFAVTWTFFFSKNQ